MSETEEVFGYTYDGGNTFSIGPASDPQCHPSITVYDRDVDRTIKLIPMIAAAPEMLAMLTEIEWCQLEINDGGTISETVKFCPKCGRSRDIGHTTDCKLAALLRRARGET